ncbi:uncharacterized mitochondrial protein AtMg00860-like [Typha latifolia]|uniref:uncharacterized mitochondrial protein AtMg00860-like n=1 Tax=Typha latifolia TaxID=4733 RepID=UPI003C30A89A
MKVKQRKCLWGEHSVEYLGYIISDEGVATNPNKVSCMVGWPRLRIVQELRGFLGLTGYYHWFVARYSKIGAPFTSLLRKNAFKWTNEVTRAFEELKAAMTTTPVLALPDFRHLFVVECDASWEGIDIILM